jgi:Lon protease-like protein
MSSSERVLPLFPLEQVVLFPGMSLPLRIFEERYKVMIAACQVTDQVFGVTLIRNGSEVGEPAVPERVGCTARMLRVDRQPNGQMLILTIGEQRFRLHGPARVMSDGYLVGDAQLLSDDPTPGVPIDLLEGVTAEFERYRKARLARAIGLESASPPEPAADPVRLSYQVAASLHVHPRECQRLLETEQVVARLQQELSLLKRENQPATKTIGPFSVN